MRSYFFHSGFFLLAAINSRIDLKIFLSSMWVIMIKYDLWKKTTSEFISTSLTIARMLLVAKIHNISTVCYCYWWFWKKNLENKHSPDQPVRWREWYMFFISLPLQAQTAPATTVPIGAGERTHCNHDGSETHITLLKSDLTAQSVKSVDPVNYANKRIQPGISMAFRIGRHVPSVCKDRKSAAFLPEIIIRN